MAARNFKPVEPHKLSAHDVKALVRYRDGYRCTDCGMTDTQHHIEYNRTLDVHRIVPGSPYTVDRCVALCCACHYLKPKSARTAVAAIAVPEPSFPIPKVKKTRTMDRHKPRNMIPLSIEIHAQLKELAAFLDIPISRLASQILAEAVV